MKYIIKNLGPVKDASIELADLTIICGKNNTGKTYLTYSLYAFLKTFNKNIVIPVDEQIFDSFMKQGMITLNLEQYIDPYIEEIKKVMPKFCASLPKFLAMSPDRFKTTFFGIVLIAEDVRQSLIRISDSAVPDLIVEAQITETCLIRFRRNPDSFKAEVELINKSSEIPHRDIIRKALGALLAKAFDAVPEETSLGNDFYESLFPPPFIITCERTGASLFRTELVISQELSMKNDDNISKRRQLNTKYEFRGYQLPVSQDLQFVIQLKDAENQQSFIAEKHHEILVKFSQIIGGVYSLKDNQVKFSPAGTKESLGLAESSSTVRSLMELNYYLKHKARRGQILMFDEPELNLHPENQRQLARLLAMLVNAGVKVFINTHSDYIIREFNTLIMLNSAKDRMAELIKEYGYDPKEFLTASQVKCYVTSEGNVKAMDVNDQYGIEVTSFDNTIRTVNLLQNKILFGE